MTGPVTAPLRILDRAVFSCTEPHVEPCTGGKAELAIGPGHIREGSRVGQGDPVIRLKRERDPALDAFDRGCLALRREGETAGHVLTTLSSFWSPGRPLTMQQWVWLVVVWADGEKERAEEDYPPWTYVREIQDGSFEWPHPGPRGGTYEAAWLPEEERAAKWTELGVTLGDF